VAAGLNMQSRQQQQRERERGETAAAFAFTAAAAGISATQHSTNKISASVPFRCCPLEQNLPLKYRAACPCYFFAPDEPVDNRENQKYNR